MSLSRHVPKLYFVEVDVRVLETIQVIVEATSKTEARQKAKRGDYVDAGFVIRSTVVSEIPGRCEFIKEAPHA